MSRENQECICLVNEKEVKNITKTIIAEPVTSRSQSLREWIISIFNKILRLNLSIQLLIILIGTIFFGALLPSSLQSFFYTISLLLKEVLLTVLPVVIFSNLFSCLINVQSKKILLLILLLFCIICVSNYFTTLITYSAGIFKTPQVNLLETSLSAKYELLTLIDLKLPKILSNQQGLCLGLLLGIWFSFFPNKTAYKFSQTFQRISIFFIEKLFIPILPIFSFGFILKMQHDGMLEQIVQVSFPLIVMIIVVSFLYLLFLFSVSANFNLKVFLKYIKSVIPVALMGFSTMSSLATMPVTLKVAEKNTGNPETVSLVIPVTSNVHLLGDCIAIPLIALSLLLSFGNEFPSFAIYSTFAIYFALAKFSVAAVPGGGILVMLPVLERYLGFSDEMLNIITALYIVFDPIVTVINVLGNSALVILISNLFKIVTRKEFFSRGIQKN